MYGAVSSVEFTEATVEILFQYHTWICSYRKHASPPYGYTPRMVQLYQPKFCGYACSQCFLFCLSVAQGHQGAVPAVHIDGHDDNHALIGGYCKHASPLYGYTPRMVQLYPLKFCGYACSQCFQFCLSVAQGYQGAVPTVHIDGHDDKLSWVCD